MVGPCFATASLPINIDISQKTSRVECEFSHLVSQPRVQSVKKKGKKGILRNAQAAEDEDETVSEANYPVQCMYTTARKSKLILSTHARKTKSVPDSLFRSNIVHSLEVCDCFTFPKSRSTFASCVHRDYPFSRSQFDKGDGD